MANSVDPRLRGDRQHHRGQPGQLGDRDYPRCAAELLLRGLPAHGGAATPQELQEESRQEIVSQNVGRRWATAMR
ncbi:hypothetical protein SPI_06895 [Niveomyces insectorum RCEF 264]|uniref:Uncharacterized protein n=1 Tax=Niveomyces insectorum RCEF 264 TaxID=1081102 RepID=A0A167QVL3_9HYPO|nr:hypothetical protein SPI_06895 [Niveomyces insectorum RCEF 264]